MKNKSNSAKFFSFVIISILSIFILFNINGCSSDSFIGKVNNSINSVNPFSKKGLDDLTTIQYSTICIDNRYSEGTGISLGNGYILTCNHVVDLHEVPREIFYILPERDLVKIDFYETKDGVTYLSGKGNIAVIVCQDKERDLALLKCDSIKETNDRKFKFNYKKFPYPAEKVYYVGGNKSNIGGITDGIVSNYGYRNGFVNIMTTCPILPGYSGGAIINKDLEVIGLLQNGHRANMGLSLAMRSDEIYIFLKNNKLEHLLD